VIKALLWDVDGTLAETERDGHLVAFNQAFAALNVPWRWSEQRYGELLAVAGGRERLLHDMPAHEQAPAGVQERQRLAERIHRVKNECYAQIVVSGALPLRDGVWQLMEDCNHAGVRMAIVTTTSRSNVDALLQTHLGGGWESRFAAVVCAENAPRKKPDPQAYRIALDILKLRSDQAIAMEDAPAGVTAAAALGVPVIVTRSHYFPSGPAEGALAIGPSLGRLEGWMPAALGVAPGGVADSAQAGQPASSQRIGLDQIARWYAQSRWAH
jgi:HAD superfamily hydrolase (TIGR01509 family)